MKSVCQGGELSYEEDELLQTLSEFAKDNGLPEVEVRRNHESLLQFSFGKCLNQPYPTLHVAGPFVDSLVPELVSNESKTTPESTKKSITMKYWISINKRSHFRRAHRRGACSIFPWNCFSYIEVDKLSADIADAYCKWCFPHMADEKNLSDESSSSSSGESVPEDTHGWDEEANESHWSVAEGMAGTGTILVDD